MGSEKEKPLTPKQEKFAWEYAFDYDRKRAYKTAYPNVKNDNTAHAAATRLLKNVKVIARIEEIESNTGKEAGISKLMIVNEHRKIAFSSIAHLHNTWIDLKEFEELSKDELDCIAETKTKVKRINKRTTETEVFIKLHDKQKSLNSLSKMLGHNEPKKIEHSGKIETEVDITQYSEEEKALLLKTARKGAHIG